MIPPDDVLRLGRVEIFEIGLGHLGRAVALRIAVKHRDRRLGKNRDRRDDDVEPALPQLLLREKGLILPGEQHVADAALDEGGRRRSEEHTSELQSLMRISYAVFCLKTKKNTLYENEPTQIYL